ncbi:hypothetical protein BpHYR1_047263 [Brachionus plicatilis]|uniref:Uncharacterized protein n=1 Tax=Brachionus plicatilis TaxID=10195 RepID=A0A3M7SNQ4_BRAPC|nr:hypothetical protein BpHYR1_047263 [Brachionus plicatilis]
MDKHLKEEKNVLDLKMAHLEANLKSKSKQLHQRIDQILEQSIKAQLEKKELWIRISKGVFISNFLHEGGLNPIWFFNISNFVSREFLSISNLRKIYGNPLK